MLSKYCPVFFSCFLLFFFQEGWSQSALLQGQVTDSALTSIEDVSIRVPSLDRGTNTDEKGTFSLSLPPGHYVLMISHVGYQTIQENIELKAGDTLNRHWILKPNVRLLEQVEIKGVENETDRREPGLIKLDPEAAKNIPSPFNDFTKILATLPGVSSNNELSSTYSVRGGNYDENLVYVNDIPVYRPFLVSAGQQEGLSFINPDMVSEVSFSSGGWQAKYGDKLSSNLNVTYKRPQQTRASLTASLLGGAAHVEGASANQKVSFLIGARLKRAQYLLNTLETNGQYLPRFTDVQSYVNIDLDGDPDRTVTELGLLTAFASNRYLVQPETRETFFGTLQEPLRLLVGYDGQEILQYRTFQQGVKLFHQFNTQWSNNLIASWAHTQEREYMELEGAYYLCQVQFDADGRQMKECNTVLGVGSHYTHARNKLTAHILNFENRTAFALNAANTIEMGVGLANEKIDDQLQQYSFSDSSDYVTIHERVYNSLDINSQRFFAFIQNTYEPNEVHSLNYGLRLNYWTLNRQWLVSPRLQYAYQPVGWRDVVFRVAAGFYQQPPFYRELRDRAGRLHKEVLAQSSWHAIAGFDYQFTMFGRPFTFLTELYYKYMYHVIPYDVDNVRIRYFAENNATAYATGIDFRINGEFIEGAESWFSLGILRTRENIEGDDRGYIRRPTDQLINLGIFFQDHLPNDPSTRVYLSLLYGTGLPFGPPNNPRYRNAFPPSDYKRVDIGFSKQIFFREEKNKDNAFLRSLWLGAEILNVLGAENTISYTWVTDVNNLQYPVPNRLSARFLNLKVIVRY